MTPPRLRGAGRPSTVAQYAPQVAQWLREDPELPGVEILRRVRLAGYRGGKSALYELVRRMRLPVNESRRSLPDSSCRESAEGASSG